MPTAAVMAYLTVVALSVAYADMSMAHHVPVDHL